MTYLEVTDAKYAGEYAVEVFFNDNTSKKVDFGKFLSKHNHPQFDKYKEIKRFKEFKIESGNLVWGKDWDLIFPVHELYKGKIKV